MTVSIHNSSPVLSRWQPYPEYKDSGIKWLGEIPSHWEVKRLRRVFKVINGSTPKTSESAHWDGDINWITPDDLGQLQTDTIVSSSRKITEKGYRSCGVSLVPAGSLVLSTRAPIGHLGIAGVALCTNQGCRSLVFQCHGDTRFFYYHLVVARPELQSWGQGATFTELSKTRLEEIYLVFPDELEQRAISTLLDRETVRIDRLIAAKERLIALLQEKRAALISHAVTKGLDPNVPMRDSGVEWLGKIPAHWEVKRLKFIGQVRSGVAKGRDLGGRSTIMIPYLRVANVQAGFLDLSDVAEIEVGVDEVERYLLQRGDVLMNEGGDFDKLGRGTVWQGQIALCIHQNHVFSVRPNYAGISEWIATVTLADYAKHYFILKSKQSTNLASISSSNLQDLPVVVPPLPEQQAILSFIRAETEKIDSLINKIAEGNVRLGEHRVALITAAVTGKIDVRG